jgi:hypothetical protein
MTMWLCRVSYHCVMHHLFSAVLRKTQNLGVLAARVSSIYGSIALFRSRRFRTDLQAGRAEKVCSVSTA